MKLRVIEDNDLSVVVIFHLPVDPNRTRLVCRDRAAKMAPQHMVGKVGPPTMARDPRIRTCVCVGACMRMCVCVCVRVWLGMCVAMARDPRIRT